MYPDARSTDKRTQTAIYGSPVSHSVSPKCFSLIWKGLDLPDHFYGAHDCTNFDDPNGIWHRNVAKSDSLGSCLTMPLKISVIPYLDGLTEEARAMGSVNTTYFRKRDDGKVQHVGSNVDAAGVRNVLLQALTGQSSPFSADKPMTFGKGSVAGLVIGGGGAARACLYALSKMNVSPILIASRERLEIDALVSHFCDLEIVPISTQSQASEVLAALQKKGLVLAVGIGAIPSDAPVTSAEKLLYEVAERVFHEASRLKSNKSSASESLPIPAQPVFLDMAYHPDPMTPLRTVAERNGWASVSGIDVVPEVCFEQAKIWTGREVPSETRERVRSMIRHQANPH